MAALLDRLLHRWSHPSAAAAAPDAADQGTTLGLEISLHRSASHATRWSTLPAALRALRRPTGGTTSVKLGRHA